MHQESLQHTLGRMDETLKGIQASQVDTNHRLERLEARNGNLSGKAWAALLGTIGVVTTAASTVAVAVLR